MRGNQLLTFFVPAFLLSCSRIPGYQVEGGLAGQHIKTTVDSGTAQYYVEKYLRNDRADPALDAMIDAAHKRWDELPLDSDRFYRRNPRNLRIISC